MKFVYNYNPQTFVPDNIYKENYDDVASDFLIHYGYEALLTEPAPVPILDIAQKKAQLTIITDQRLSPNCDILGTIVFFDGEIEVYDPKSNESHGYDVKSGTILIDCDINHKGRTNNSLAHECVHWHIHRNYFNNLRRKSYNSDIAFRCPVYSNNSDFACDTERMEAQARGIAPCILMPKIATQKKIIELFDLFEYKNELINRHDVLKSVIDNLADFFCVSKLSAKYRMRDLEFLTNDDCEVIYPQSDLKDAELIITNNPLTVKSSDRPLTRHIGLKRAFEEYKTNSDFRDVLQSGAFCYVEGAFVINNDKYICKDNSGTFKLTPYARNNPAECTLLFTYKVQSLKGVGDDLNLPPNIAKLLQGARSLTSVSTEYRKLQTYIRNNQNENARQKAEELKTALKNVSNDFEKFKTEKISLSPAKDFWTRVSQIVAIKNVSKRKFKEITLLDDRTISRTGGNAINGKPTPKKITAITMRVAMAICFGLDLDLEESKKLLSLAKLSLNNDDECLAYEFILSNFKGSSIDERNFVLEEWGFEPVGVIKSSR